MPNPVGKSGQSYIMSVGLGTSESLVAWPQHCSGTGISLTPVRSQGANGNRGCGDTGSVGCSWQSKEGKRLQPLSVSFMVEEVCVFFSHKVGKMSIFIDQGENDVYENKMK